MSLAYYLRLSTLLTNMTRKGWTVTTAERGGYRIVRGPKLTCS